MASATLVMVIVLKVTQLYYSTFGQIGRVLAWGVVLSTLLGLASLAVIVIRLYVHPVLANGRDRLAAGRGGRKRNT